MKRATGEFNTKDTKMKVPGESEGDKPQMKTNQDNDQAPMTMWEARMIDGGLQEDLCHACDGHCCASQFGWRDNPRRLQQDCS